MAKRNGTTRYAGNSQTSAANSIQSQTIGAPSNAGSISSMKVSDLYGQIDALPSKSSSERTIEYLEDNKSVTVSYNQKQDMYDIKLKENGQLIPKGAKTTTDSYKAASIVKKYFK